MKVNDKLYCYACTVSRHEECRIISSVILGYATCKDEETAKSIAYNAANKRKPTFQIDDAVVLEIPLSAIKALKGEGND